VTIVGLADSVQPPSLIQDDAPQPRPGRGELLIRVRAAGVTLKELSWYPTTHRQTGEARTGALPAHEFSGVIAGVGEDVGGLEIGQEVFGMNDRYPDGAMAQDCIAPFFALAPKPRRLTHVEAASVPIGALTAWQGLFDHAKLQPGEPMRESNKSSLSWNPIRSSSSKLQTCWMPGGFERLWIPLLRSRRPPMSSPASFQGRDAARW